MPKQQSFHIRNWPDYNEALVQRGSITFWFDEAAISTWHPVKTTKKRGRPLLYTAIAIECALMLRAVYRLPLRGTEGLIRSLIRLSGLPLKAPDYTTLCIRQKTLKVMLPQYHSKSESLHIVVDSTGLKVFGEGEWKVRQHGYTQRRTWRKLHIAVNAETQVIEAAVVTTNDFKDSELLSDLLDNVDNPIDQVSGDGGYDSQENYHYVVNKGAKAVIPPRRDAVTAQHGNYHSPPLPRDEVIRAIRRLGRKEWKKQNNYHQRSLAETAMYRLKTILGEGLRSRIFENQATEALLRCSALNKMTSLGMPDSYCIP